MEKLNNTVLLFGSTIVALFMATFMIFIRSKVAKKPTSVKRIILPPIFMSSGTLMFIFPMFRISLLELSEAVFVGILCSDRKSTRLNSSHVAISYAVFCLKKKIKTNKDIHL